MKLIEELKDLASLSKIDGEPPFKTSHTERLEEFLYSNHEKIISMLEAGEKCINDLLEIGEFDITDDVELRKDKALAEWKKAKGEDV